MSRTTKVRTTLGLGAVAVAVAVLAALTLVPRPAPAAPALKPYKVGFNAWIGSIAFFVARDKGFFKDEGLDLQAKSFSAPGDGLTPLLTGDLDAHLSTADSVLTVLDKAPGQLKVVYLTDTSAGAERCSPRRRSPTSRR